MTAYTRLSLSLLPVRRSVYTWGTTCEHDSALSPAQKSSPLRLRRCHCYPQKHPRLAPEVSLSTAT